MEDIPHPRYGDVRITLGHVKNAKDGFIRFILNSAKVDTFISKVKHKQDVKCVTLLYETNILSGDVIRNISIYSLLNNEYDWKELESSLKMRLHVFIDITPKIKIERKCSSVYMYAIWKPFIRH